MSGVELLACAILEQAIEDYKSLKTDGVFYPKKIKGDKYGDETIKKHMRALERFFRSEWCSDILSISDCKLKGQEIFEMLESLHIEPKEVAV